MSIEVIGAGFGRTGTMSLKIALEQLGFGKCYHMAEFIDNPQDVTHWEKAMDKNKVDWETLFSGYQSTVDFPGCLYVEELMAAFPEAKVVLSIRDPEAWWESASATILKAAPPFPIKLRMALRYPFVKRVRKIMRLVIHNVKSIYKGTFNGKPMDKKNAIQVFKNHNDAIKKLVPKENLLIYEVTEGWKPLCEFLEVDIPDSDFPRLNSRNQFEEMMAKIYYA